MRISANAYHFCKRNLVAFSPGAAKKNLCRLSRLFPPSDIDPPPPWREPSPVTPASPITMLFMAMVGRLQRFRRCVWLPMVLVEDTLAYFNLLSSLSYVILLISTLNARAARLYMISLDHGERDGI